MTEEMLLVQKMNAPSDANATRESALRELIANFRDEVSSLLGESSENDDQMRLNAEALLYASERVSSRIGAAGGEAGEVSRNVDSITGLIEKLHTSIEEEAKLVSQTSGVVSNTAEVAYLSDEKITELGEATELIGNVVSLIRKIAKQSNLLALNATIEAARAGESGKGFAVVASEVRQLTKQTSEAAEEISSQITNIRAATGDAIRSIHDIAQKMREANTATMTIATAVEQQRAATNEIFHNVQKAAAAAGESNEIIIGLTLDAGEASQSTNLVFNSSQASIATTAKLRKAVESFLTHAEAL
jgi:methyl-accepting chemotaxis protein